MQWFGFPAILKGWIDRVFVLGKVFGYGDFYSNGVFRGRKALLSFTTGGPESMYGKTGINGNKDVLLWPMNGILNFVGYDVLQPHINHAVAHQNREALEEVKHESFKLIEYSELDFLLLKSSTFIGRGQKVV